MGHPSRPALRTAIVSTTLNALAFVIFAVVTTQVTPVRSGSPWQDDPYDTVVTFTMFFVPITVFLILVRALLCRRDEPVPLYRTHQVIRACALSALLVSATCVTDWAAFAVKADHRLWDGGTPWLIVGLGAVSVLAALNWLVQILTWRLVPRHTGEQPTADCLEDVRLVVELLAHRGPGPVGRLASRLGQYSGTLGWIRRHFILIAAVASVTCGLAVATGLARENGFGWLFPGETVWFAGGMYAFLIICDAILGLTVRPAPGRLSRAAQASVTAGAAALPVSLALRQSIWSAARLGGTIGTPGQYVALTFTCALLVSMVTFGVMVAVTMFRAA